MPANGLRLLAFATRQQPKKLQAEGIPERIDAPLDCLVHNQRTPPFAVCLPRPFMGGVDAHLAAEARHRRCKIKRVDRRILGNQGIARRINAGRHRPDDLFPVTDVYVVIDDDNELGVHELTQKAPDTEHDAAGVAGILFTDADHRQPVRAAFRRQVEIGDFGILFLQNRDEHFIERHGQHGRLIGRLARVGAVINRIFTHREALDGKNREHRLFVVVAGMVAERAFQRRFVRPDNALQHDLRRGRHL